MAQPNPRPACNGCAALIAKGNRYAIACSQGDVRSCDPSPVTHASLLSDDELLSEVARRISRR